MASRLFLVRIISCFLVLLPLRSLGYICPGPITPPHGLSYARIEPNISGRAEEVYEKIRMKLFYDSSIEDKPYKELVQEAADFWSNVLSVKRVDGRLFKPRDCEPDKMTSFKALDGSGKREKYCLGSCNNITKCYHVEVPREHLDGCHYCTQHEQNCTKNEPEPGTGIENADIVFYVTALDLQKCQGGSTVGYAGFCDIEPVLDRPVFGMINVCATNVARKIDDKKALLQTIKHEFLHPLCFTQNQLKLFRDKEGKPLWPRDEYGEPILNNTGFATQKVLKDVIREWHVRGDVIKSVRTFLVTPNVVREARNHFGCSELEGAELEDIPRSGSQYNHFEARVFYDEGMKANMDTGKGSFSRLSFALLEDSGWYQVKYSLAEEMDFGRNLGCDFCMKSCKFWMDKKRKEGKSVDPYCDSPDIWYKRGFSCYGTKKRFSGCPLTKLDPKTIEKLHDSNSTEPPKELPRKYQNFDQISEVKDDELSQFGSLDFAADCCPLPMKNVEVKKDLGDGLKCGKEPNTTLKPNSTTTPDETSSLNFTLEQNSTTTQDETTSLNFTLEPNSTTTPDETSSLNFTLEQNSTTTQDETSSLNFTLKLNSTTTPDETSSLNLTSEPWEPTTTSTPGPVVEAKGDEDETAVKDEQHQEMNGSSHIGSFVQLVILSSFMAILL